MSDCMSFPKTVEEYMDFYKVVDSEGIYMSKGTELVPIFRMKQWFEHQTDRMKFVQEAVNTLMNTSKTNSIKDKCFRNAARLVQNAIDGEPQDFERIPDEPQRTGRWIIKDNPGTGWYRVTCSECGEDVTSTAPCIGVYPNAKVTWDYCPNCGADMRTPVEIARNIVHEAIDNSAWSDAVDPAEMHKVVDDKYAEIRGDANVDANT